VIAHRSTNLEPRRRHQQKGFTLMEVLISMFVLTVGLVSMLGVFATAMAATQSAQQDMIAKQLAQQAMETIFTARETQNIVWAQIQNEGGAGSPGIFVTGLQPINQPGIDGIYGTDDDSDAAEQIMILPGPDGIVQTAQGATVAAGDDVVLPLTNYQRSITITNTASGDLRQIVVIVQYVAAGLKVPRQYVLSGFISQYR
jgi:prepilin-type N-terminal cleavage/methylation domain-containing protein